MPASFLLGSCFPKAASWLNVVGPGGECRGWQCWERPIPGKCGTSLMGNVSSRMFHQFCWTFLELHCSLRFFHCTNFLPSPPLTSSLPLPFSSFLLFPWLIRVRPASWSDGSPRESEPSGEASGLWTHNNLGVNLAPPALDTWVQTSN